MHAPPRAPLRRLTNPNFVVIMHTTMNDFKAEELVKLWQRALLVASFHDLPAWAAKHAPYAQESVRWAARAAAPGTSLPAAYPLQPSPPHVHKLHCTVPLARSPLLGAPGCRAPS